DIAVVEGFAYVLGEMDEDKVSFGFEDVSRDEKSRRVKGVFASVAGKYDLMNDLMSAGVHRIWKANMIAWLNPQPGETLIDVAGGTGDGAGALREEGSGMGQAPGFDRHVLRLAP